MGGSPTQHQHILNGLAHYSHQRNFIRIPQGMIAIFGAGCHEASISIPRSDEKNTFKRSIVLRVAGKLWKIRNRKINKKKQHLARGPGAVS